MLVLPTIDDDSLVNVTCCHTKEIVLSRDMSSVTWEITLGEEGNAVSRGKLLLLSVNAHFIFISKAH